MYYMSKHTGKIFTETQISIINDIYGKDELKDCLEARSIIQVSEPSVIDFIKCGNMSGATIRYRELHGCKTKAAYDAVYEIKRDMYRFSKKNGKEEK